MYVHIHINWVPDQSMPKIRTILDVVALQHMRREESWFIDCFMAHYFMASVVDWES